MFCVRLYNKHIGGVIMLITIKEYAERNGVSYDYLRTAICKGKFIPDKKIGQRWYVEENKEWFTKKRNIDKSMYNGKPMSYSRVYNIWRCMKQRCYNKNNSRYYLYGGRGITVCDEWKDNSKTFIDWALSNGYSDDLEIDRIDNDLGYSPDNCQWITRKENIAKKNKPYTYDPDVLWRRRLYNSIKRDGFEPPMDYPLFEWEKE